MLALSAVPVALFTAAIVIRGNLVDETGIGVFHLKELALKPNTVRIVLTTILFMNCLIGDAIMFWRVFVLWEDRKKMILVPGVLLFLAGVSEIALATCYVVGGPDRLEMCEPARILLYALTVQHQYNDGLLSMVLHLVCYISRLYMPI
ncbi:hypothetical protein VNI00_014574 [Paramarasmius palmivorus]|uniref:Uncharacterized protein n=1 Tax=Paramarasmius palmivorus TaxID=297713 RepID=A0AAW0BRR2_9AGAR